MPFFIPIMIGASLISMLPSFLPNEQKRANQVINQDGNNYFRRQGWRTGNPQGTSRNPYPKVQSDNVAGHGINFQQWIIYGGLGIAALIALKFLVGR